MDAKLNMVYVFGRDVGQGTRGFASASIDTDFEPKSSGSQGVVNLPNP